MSNKNLLKQNVESTESEWRDNRSGFVYILPLTWITNGISQRGMNKVNLIERQKKATTTTTPYYKDQ